VGWSTAARSRRPGQDRDASLFLCVFVPLWSVLVTPGLTTKAQRHQGGMVNSGKKQAAGSRSGCVIVPLCLRAFVVSFGITTHRAHFPDCTQLLQGRRHCSLHAMGHFSHESGKFCSVLDSAAFSAARKQMSTPGTTVACYTYPVQATRSYQCTYGTARCMAPGSG
jgi:hypothetical protein